MEGMIMTAQLLLSLSILIVVHEGGHFVAARMFKIKVEKFYLFFDFLFPMANVLNFSLIKFKKGDTEYGIGWFPLGGYLNMADRVDEGRKRGKLRPPAEPWEFRSKPAWQRLIVMLGGIIVNVVVGILIFIGITYILGDTYIPNKFVNANGGIYVQELGEQIGLKTGDRIIKLTGKDFDDLQDVVKPDVLLSQGSYYTVLRDGKEVNISIPENFIENFSRKEAMSNFVSPRIPAIVGHIADEVEIKIDRTKTVEGPSIARKIGLRAGDRFLEVDGQPVRYQDELIKLVKKGPRDSISFRIKRGEEVLAFKENFKGQEMIGFAPRGIDKKELAYMTYGFGQSIGLGSKRAFDVIFIQLKAFKKIFSGEISFRKSLSGPIGMAQAYGGGWGCGGFCWESGLFYIGVDLMTFMPSPALEVGFVMCLVYTMTN